MAMPTSGKVTTTLCLVRDGDQILLGLKKRGFGAGRWNGFGGKVEAGESIDEAAHRELMEEAGVLATLDEVGVITFTFKDSDLTLEMHVFSANGCEGTPTESEEMAPKWYSINEIPFAMMWPDDPYWFPHFLEGKKFRCSFHFEGHDKILHHQIQIL